MDLNTRPSGCVNVYADLLRKTTRLLTPPILILSRTFRCVQ